MGIITPNQHKKDEKAVIFSLVNSKNLVLIFTRNPVLGKCKTRLAATVGDEAALAIYKFLLDHTVSITKNLAAAKKVYYSEEIWENDIWDSQIYDKQLQHGADLGERMANAFQDGFAQGFEKIIVIGSDMFEIDETTIDAAFSALSKSDFVVGPATDGGYYLLGMTHFKASLFTKKEWGTDTVLQSTLHNLSNEKYSLLQEKNDIDRYEDIKGNPAFSHFLKLNY